MIGFLLSMIIISSLFYCYLVFRGHKAQQMIVELIKVNRNLDLENIRYKNSFEFASKMLKYLLDNRKKLDVYKDIYFAEMEVNGKYFVMTNKDGEFNIECFDHPWGSDPDDKIIN